MADFRFLVDDASLRMPDGAVEDVEDSLDNLSDNLQAARDEHEPVGILSGYDTIESAPGVPLWELLNSERISRDCRVRAYRLLDKCGRFDADDDFIVDPEVRVGSSEVESFAMATIAGFVRTNVAVGALHLWSYCGGGAVTVHDSAGQVEVFVLEHLPDRPKFYRTVFSVEDTPEGEFFEVARRAYPDLRFADGLSFGRFDGSYVDLRDTVVAHLSAINDNFKAVLTEAHGLSDEVSARLGIAISIEGSARQSEHLMAERDVEYRGETYRCEWHSKLEPHRNRIHLHPGDEGTDHCVLVGLFVDHLPT